MKDNTSFLKRRPLAQSSNKGAQVNSAEASMCNLVSELMNARTSFHKLHLKVTGSGSFASHLALNELYDALPGHADNLVEQYQGATERLCSLPDSTPRTLNTKEEGIQYIREIKDMVTNVQGTCEYTEIINDLDTIKSCLNSIKYKLIFLA